MSTSFPAAHHLRAHQKVFLPALAIAPIVWLILRDCPADIAQRPYGAARA